MDILVALEASGFAMWVKESSTAYVAVLAFHTIGLAFLVGISTAIAMRILGAAPAIPLQAMEDFFPLMYVGLAINLFTGTVLVTLYPTDYLFDPAFYIKLGAIISAIVILLKLKALVFDRGGGMETPSAAKNLAWALLAAWMVAITTGRVTAYSIPTKLQTAAAVLVCVAVALLAGYLYRRLGRRQSSSEVA